MELKRVSLSYELAELSGCLEAARLITKGVAETDLADVRDNRDGGYWASCVLSLCIQRIGLLARAVYGSADPALLLAPHNEAIVPADGDDAEDIILIAWSVERRRSEAIGELRRTAQSNIRKRPRR